MDHSESLSTAVNLVFFESCCTHSPTYLFILLVDMRKVRKTPLVFAAMNGHYRIMAFLLRIGVNPDAPDSSKSTPMHYAAAHGWYHCVQLLLDAGAEPNVMNEYQVRTARWLVIP